MRKYFTKNCRRTGWSRSCFLLSHSVLNPKPCLFRRSCFWNRIDDAFFLDEICETKPMCRIDDNRCHSTLILLTVGVY